MITNKIKILSKKYNIYYQFRNKHIANNFKKELLGYHIIHHEPLKEARWEELNRNIVCPFYRITLSSSGNHLSGRDNRIGSWNISNKTTKINIKNNKMVISSYRLTSVCSQREPNNIKNIINEIKKRSSNFEYYSVLAREEYKINKINYVWYIIPKNFILLDVTRQVWRKKIGKTGKNIGKQIGWMSDDMEIIFSMSSQLWHYISKESIEKYKISETLVDKEKLPKLSYSELYNKFF